MPVVRHEPSDDVCVSWMGLPPDREAERRGEPGWHQPVEPIEDGCPASWYLSRFSASLELYLPTRSGDALMESPLIDKATDRLILEAVQYYKHQRSRADGHYFEVASERD